MDVHFAPVWRGCTSTFFFFVFSSCAQCLDVFSPRKRQNSAQWAGALSGFPQFFAQCTDQKGPRKRQNSSQVSGAVTSFPLRFYRNYRWGQGLLGNYTIILLFLFAGVWRVSRARQQRSTLTRHCVGACGVFTPSEIYFRLARRCVGRSSLHRHGALPETMSG